MQTPPARPDPFEPDASTVRATITRALGRGAGWLAPEETATVLTGYGITHPLARNAENPEEAAAAAAAIGFPVALKIRSPDVVHKSDVGGVILNLADQASVREATASLLARVRAARPDARIEGIIVQQLIDRPSAVELLVGLSEDPVFGPVVVFGQGGTAVEVVRDSAIGLPPLNLLLARAQMERTRIWRLLQGYRDKPPAAIDAVAEILIRVGQLAADHPEIRELDINPLLADPDGVIAVDTRIRVAPAEQVGAARLAIAPYPKEFETIEPLPDGAAVQVRPVRPEDEPVVVKLFDHMSPEDLRLRFFAPMRHLSHALAARLTQIDYDREMALLALRKGTAVGIAHFYADPDRQRAEYAIAVRSDQKGRGIGYLMLTRLIDIARQWAIGELMGEVLRENEPMLLMCRSLGFRITPDPEAGAVLLVHKPLTDPGHS